MILIWDSLLQFFFFDNQFILKDFHNFAKSVLYATGCNIQDFGSLPDRQSLVVMQVHSLFFVFIEPIHGLIKLLCQLAFGNICKRR